MNTKTQRLIGIGIMSAALIIGIYALIVSFDSLYDISTLIFLIGIIINDWGVYRLLGKYEEKYGKIEE